MERVDVGDEPVHEVAAAVRVELARRERLDLPVDGRADPAERAQREVVGRETLEVARQRPREREEADDDDRRRQREDRRLLGRPRDEIAGGGHQRDPEADGERAEHQGERHPAAGHAGKPEQATGRPHATASATRADADDPVGTLGELGPVRDEHERPALSQHVDRVGDDRGALRIEVGRRLVEQHQRRVPQERARERDAPPLTRRERTSSFADHRLVSVGKRADELVARGRVPLRRGPPRRPQRARRA